MIEVVRVSVTVLVRLGGIFAVVAGVGFSLLNALPGYFTGICGICPYYPLYDEVVGGLTITAYYWLGLSAFLAGVFLIIFADKMIEYIAWLAYPPALLLVYVTAFVAGFSWRGTEPSVGAITAFIGASVLTLSIPLIAKWGPRPAAVAALGAGLLAISSYPPVVNRVPFHPTSTNMFQATMELMIIGHPIVMAVLTVVAASAALSTSHRLVTGIAAAPLAAVAYSSEHLAEVMESSMRYMGVADRIVQLGLHLIAGAAIAGAVLLIILATLPPRR